MEVFSGTVYIGIYLGSFASNLGDLFVFEAEQTGTILALGYGASHSWHNIWIESDSTSAVQDFKNVDFVSFRQRNRCHNSFHLGLQAISSHIYGREIVVRIK